MHDKFTDRLGQSARLGSLMALTIVMSWVYASQAVGLVPPRCSQDGNLFFGEEDLEGGLRIIPVKTPNSQSPTHVDRIILADCEAKRQVTVDTVAAENYGWVRAELIRMAARSQTYTFQDVVNNISQGGIRAKIDVIHPNSCACAAKE